MDLFDIIGPVMIGPSSSHTAGAARIGKITRMLLNSRPVHARIGLYGSFQKTYQGHGTDKALVGGPMRMGLTIRFTKRKYAARTPIPSCWTWTARTGGIFRLWPRLWAAAKSSSNPSMGLKQAFRDMKTRLSSPTTTRRA